MFILTAEPKELTIVLILGPIAGPAGQLKGLAGWARWATWRKTRTAKTRTSQDKGQEQGQEGRRPMKRLLADSGCFCGAAGSAVVVLAGSGEGGFDGVVQLDREPLSRAGHAHSVHGAGQPDCAQGHTWRRGRLHVAEFENFTEPVDGEN